MIADVISGARRWHVECGDAIDVLRGVRADAVITDAPFGISDAPMMHVADDGKRHGNRTARAADYHAPSEWDAAIDPRWCALACEIAPVVAWFGSWRKRAEVEAAMTHPIRCEVIWAKDTHVGPPCPAAMRDERIWIFAAAGLKPRHFETTVWDEPIIPTWAHRSHKNEKPIRLMRRLVRWLVAPDAVIVDPFCGSGTTIAAALMEGVRAIGSDIDPAHAEIARTRCANVDNGNAPTPTLSTQTPLDFSRVLP